MKKIFLFSLIGWLGFIGFVDARTCGPVTVSFEGNQDPDDNEFLYRDKNEFDLTKNGYENSGHKNSGSGHAYECDEFHSGSCTTGDEITLASGHVFKGKVINSKKTYRCNTDFEDYWVEVTSKNKCTTRWGDLSVGDMLQKTKTTAECSGITLTEPNTDAVESWYVVCREGGTVFCKPAKCNEGYTPEGEKCVKDCPDCEKTDSLPSVSPVKPTNETCAGGFQLGGLMDTKDCKNVNISDSDLKTGKECKKVCLKNTDTGEVKGMWYISECPKGMTGVEANYTNIYPHGNHRFEKCMKGNVVGPVKKCDVWKNNPEAFACCNAGLTWNDADKKCEGCPDGKEWNWDAKQKKGECVDKGDDVNPGVVPNGTCQYLFKANVKCANGNTYDVKKHVPVSNTTAQSCEEFLKIYTPDEEAVLKIEQEICKNPGGYVVISYGPTQAQVNEARNKISSFFNTAESTASVWKDSEGKFNTARLASDLTAGVVLGTVGGVVSGVVIKKKQVEKGFEALHCTVGGQPIADWGDTFNVGLR